MIASAFRTPVTSMIQVSRGGINRSVGTSKIGDAASNRSEVVLG
jgi:hypothetical protein